MTLTFTIAIVLVGSALLGLIGYLLGFRRAKAAGAKGRLHSQPPQHGGYVASLAAGVPLLVGSIFGVILLFRPKSEFSAGADDVVEASSAFPMVSTIVLLVLGVIAMIWGLRRITSDFRARTAGEKIIRGTLVGSAFLSIATTVGIVASILFQAISFFRGDEAAGRPGVGVWDFLSGTIWSPEAAFLQSQGSARAGESFAEPLFGAVPIFAGTFMITTIALLLAVPIGIFAAIYLSEYASDRVRKTLKPLLELLAGIPTVVYGFFAVVTVAPLVVAFFETLGFEAVSYQNALTCGLVMGIMIIPLVSSLSDDVIRAVPNALREGSLALGTTRAETVSRVILPAALPGIVSAVLLAISRAIGETMIVVMAASLRANLTANPLEDMTTVTVRIVSALVGDKSFDSAETLSAFALGLVLFLLTLILNVAATMIIRNFRRKYAL